MNFAGSVGLVGESSEDLLELHPRTRVLADHLESGDSCIQAIQPCDSQSRDSSVCEAIVGMSDRPVP
jgi:hypothetical protein